MVTMVPYVLLAVTTAACSVHPGVREIIRTGVCAVATQ
jgi:hypothetical protein